MTIFYIPFPDWLVTLITFAFIITWSLIIYDTAIIIQTQRRGKYQIGKWIYTATKKEDTKNESSL